ncbi:MAG: right-handed parallel beta-helix repeat-containing protein, partial [Alphaproteobacteria bacterium]
GQIALVGGDGAGAVQVAGTLDASGAQAGTAGGTVHVLGDAVALNAGADIDVSGPAGGGTALVGGAARGAALDPLDAIAGLDAGRYDRSSETTYFDADASIDASATDRGNGGMAIVWSDVGTAFHGVVAARGGAGGGDGGLVEVSGAELVFTGLADRSAAAGRAGLLLLDPNLLRVTAAADGTAGNTQRVNDATLNANLALGDVVLQADSRIVVEAGTTVDTQGNTLYFDTLRVQLFADIVGNVDGGAAAGAALATLIGGPALPGNDPARVDVAGTSLRGIQQALEISGDGARVSVAAGTYGDPSDAVNGSAPLLIDHAVTLLGAQATVPTAGRTAGGAGETILDFAAATGAGGTGAAIRVTASDVRIDGFDIVADADLNAAVRIQDTSGGATPVENVFVYNDFIRPSAGTIGGYGVVTSSAGAYRNVQVRNSGITGTDREAIRLSNVDDVVIRDNHLALTGRDAIKLDAVGSAARPSLQIIDNVIEDIAGDGVEIDGIDGPLVVRGNSLTAIAGDGVNVATALGDVSVVDNTMTDTGGSAVEIDSVGAGGTARVIDNRLTDIGGDGVDIANVEGLIRVDDNVIADTDGDGIQIVGGGAIVQVTGNSVANSNAANDPTIHRDLIDISQVVGTVRVRDNILDNADDNAIEVSLLQSRLLIADNVVTGTRNDDGIAVDQVAGPARITGNQVGAAAENGVLVTSTQRITVDTNEIVGNTLAGVVIENAPVSQVLDNTVAGNGGDGVVVVGDGGLTRVARNAVTGNAGNGVAVVGLSRANVDTNVVGGIVAQPGSVDGPSAPDGNGDNGVEAIGVALLRVHNNHLNFNGGNGVSIADGVGSVDARENYVHQNGGNGFALLTAPAAAAISNNSIVGNGGVGLLNGGGTVDALYNWWGSADPAAVAALIAGGGTVSFDPFYVLPDDINGPNGLVAPTGLGPFAFQGGTIIVPPTPGGGGGAAVGFDATALLLPQDETVVGRNLQTPGDDVYFRLPEEFGYGADTYGQTYDLGDSAGQDLAGLAPAAGGNACPATDEPEDEDGVDFTAPVQGLRIECAFDPTQLEPAAGGQPVAAGPAAPGDFLGAFMSTTYLGGIGWFDQPG